MHRVPITAHETSAGKAGVAHQVHSVRKLHEGYKQVPRGELLLCRVGAVKRKSSGVLPYLTDKKKMLSAGRDQS